MGGIQGNNVTVSGCTQVQFGDGSSMTNIVQSNSDNAKLNAFVAELEKLKLDIETAKNNKTFDEEDAAIIKQYLEGAISLANKPNLEKNTITEKLNNATHIARNISKFVAAAKPITEALIAVGSKIAMLP